MFSLSRTLLASGIAIFFASNNQFVFANEDLRDAASLNNTGVKAMSVHDFAKAEASFMAALKLKPDYTFARENLAILYNNKALKETPIKSRDLFAKSLLLAPNNMTTKKNFDEAIENIAKGSSSKRSKLAAANKAIESKNFVLANAYCRTISDAANDNNVSVVLAKLPPTLELLSTMLAIPVKALEQANSAPKQTIDSLADADFGPYMGALQRRIKKGWFPPKGSETKRVIVVFQLDQSGTLVKLALDKTSGDKVSDEAALEAVRNGSPFDVLPTGSPKYVDIQFTFDYHAFGEKGSSSYSVRDGEAKVKQHLVADSKIDIAKKNYSAAIEKLERALVIGSDGVQPLLASTLAKQAQTLSDTPNQGLILHRAILLGAPDTETKPLLNEWFKATAKNPESAEDRLTLADQASDRLDFDTAIVEYRESIRLKPNDETKAKLTLLENNKQNLEHLKRWQKLAEQNPNSSDAHIGLATGLMKLEKWQHAQKEAQRAIEINPDSEQAKIALRAIREKLKQ
ncbi:MAG: TonB family protein [Candidatus Obscuribacterales bacterium]|nr:TonB family protein [Candidatus Obscuribacterales bacterium]